MSKIIDNWTQRLSVNYWPVINTPSGGKLLKIEVSMHPGGFLDEIDYLQLFILCSTWVAQIYDLLWEKTENCLLLILLLFWQFFILLNVIFF